MNAPTERKDEKHDAHEAVVGRQVPCHDGLERHDVAPLAEQAAPVAVDAPDAQPVAPERVARVGDLLGARVIGEELVHDRRELVKVVPGDGDEVLGGRGRVRVEEVVEVLHIAHLVSLQEA